MIVHSAFMYEGTSYYKLVAVLQPIELAVFLNLLFYEVVDILLFNLFNDCITVVKTYGYIRNDEINIFGLILTHSVINILKTKMFNSSQTRYFEIRFFLLNLFVYYYFNYYSYY